MSDKLRAAALAEPEQEPIAWYHDDFGVLELNRYERVGWSPLYSAPPRREWVGLTDREFQPMIQKAMAYYGYDKSKPSHLTAGAGFRVFANAIEAKLREKNT